MHCGHGQFPAHAARMILLSIIPLASMAAYANGVSSGVVVCLLEDGGKVGACRQRGGGVVGRKVGAGVVSMGVGRAAVVSMGVGRAEVVSMGSGRVWVSGLMSISMGSAGGSGILTVCRGCDG
jgi:hypothetical protein